MRPTLQCANRISFAVSVPVLSLNTKSTCWLGTVCPSNHYEPCRHRRNQTTFSRHDDISTSLVAISSWQFADIE